MLNTYNSELKQKVDENRLKFMKSKIKNWQKIISDKIEHSYSVCKICAGSIPTALMEVHSSFCLQSYDLRQEIGSIDSKLAAFLLEFKAELRKLKLSRGQRRDSMFRKTRHSLFSEESSRWKARKTSVEEH